MEAGVVLLLLFSLLGIASSLSFYGDSISFVPLQKKTDGTFKVTFYHRQNGRSNCQDQSSFACESGVCTSFDKSSVLQTDQDNTGQGLWCQSEGNTTATVLTNKTSFFLRDSGCCWVPNVEGKTNWTTHTELDLGTRSDTHSLNSCPVTATVSYLRVPQNCFSRIHILAYDPDGDEVKCRFAASNPTNFTLDETACTLTSTGDIQTGIHVFELMIEDFSTKNITLTYSDGTSVFQKAYNMSSPPLCKVKLQFSVEVLLPIPNCDAGFVQPKFLYRTPLHGDILHATVGQTFQLYAQAQAQDASIFDFQVSGPENMTKVFKDDALGKAEVTLSWTPQYTDLYRSVPVCFTAETNHTQSEMRCVVVLVTQASTTQGKVTVQCSPNKMTVAVEKASIAGIDENFLKLSDPSCSLTSNSTHIMGAMSFSTCGTKVEEKGDFIIFKNGINSFELANEVITRRRTVKINFSCQFPKAISISNYYNLQNADYIFTESSFGSFGYTFEIFRNSNFTNKVEASAYPVQVNLLQTIFMGIHASADLPNVTLFVESCKATPDNNPENTLSYYIIRNGCLEDKTVVVYPSDQTIFNFGVQAFKFTGNYDQVYITCSVILCESGSPFSRCAQGCLKDPSRRRRRDLSSETVSHYITQGPLQFVGQPVPSAAKDSQDVLMDRSGIPAAVSPQPASPDTKSALESWEIKNLFSSNISTVVFASAFLVSVVLLAVVIHHKKRKQKAEECNVLIVSEWEN
ncbi:uncharacterized protein LOC115776464 [Archocentrus centrarchus]|uniref:uncharacterized protein LOC115776464 n=1 Tax=Archocentrus centrarchus TaxID=63155 RepID=UPI0011EA2779|nr:uncharacterized protein LOC115776464 [Archocentrus centrarchus]